MDGEIQARLDAIDREDERQNHRLTELETEVKAMKAPTWLLV